MNHLAESLAELKIGDPQTVHNLTMIPLLNDNVVEADYLLLDQALELNVIEVSEVSDSGSVPELKVLNKGTQRILLLDGEELLGAKQNRILNVTVMVPAQQTITIPVSCVEAGRWHHQSRTFSSAGRAHFAEGRARKTRRVNESMRVDGSRRGRQGEVWADISEKAMRMDAASQTDAADVIYKTHRRSLDEYLNGFTGVANQTGAIFNVNGSTTGVDLFNSTSAMSGCLNKLVESYALDAIDYHRSGESEKNGVDVKRFLDGIGQSEAHTYPAVGEGEDLRFDNDDLSGGALIVDDSVVHLCGFKVEEQSRVPIRRTRMDRASNRSRNRRV